MEKLIFPTVRELFKRHEDTYIEVFSLALPALVNSKCYKKSEPEISEVLCTILNKVCFEKSRDEGYEIPPPLYEAPVQPIDESDLGGGKAMKRPDFTCNIINSMAESADEYQIPYHVECKRLGLPTSKNWVLNKNYVVSGIMRYDSSEHEYGKRAFSGLMIGYIVSMMPEQILAEVNLYQKTHCIDNPDVEFNAENNGVQQYSQKLNRKNVKPEDFVLTHLWVDLK